MREPVPSKVYAHDSTTLQRVLLRDVTRLGGMGPEECMGSRRESDGNCCVVVVICIRIRRMSLCLAAHSLEHHFPFFPFGHHALPSLKNHYILASFFIANFRSIARLLLRKRESPPRDCSYFDVCFSVPWTPRTPGDKISEERRAMYPSRNVSKVVACCWSARAIGGCTSRVEGKQHFLGMRAA